MELDSSTFNAFFSWPSRGNMSSKIRLKDGVIFLNDLGMVFLDNGQATVQMSLKAFEQTLLVQKTGTHIDTPLPDFFEWEIESTSNPDRLSNADYFWGQNVN